MVRRLCTKRAHKAQVLMGRLEAGVIARSSRIRAACCSGKIQPMSRAASTA
jgi:hypothetical protein